MEAEKGTHDGVLRALTKAEDLLAFLADRAINERRYEDASVLMELAASVKNASHRFMGFVGKPTALRAPATSKNSHNSEAAKTPLRRRGPAYPKFFRDGEVLVKVGWSKRQKAEYEHRTPFRVLPLLQAALSKPGGNRRRFTMDSILPLSDEVGGGQMQVPSYQAYAALAWLKSIGLVVQHGRQGYSIPHPDQVAKTVEARWSGLPGRDGQSVPKGSGNGL